ncbi:MAG: MFS transporter [Solirubrobacterales bacterium]|nr:MFS transporter [Solirubrobacterales bacterium]
MVALAFVASLASSPGQSYWLAIFVDDLIDATGLSRTAFSTLYAAATGCSALTVMGVGRLVDRRGVGTAWAVVAVGLTAGCLAAGSATGALGAFLALALLRAFGQGSFPLLGTLMIAGRFDAWRGRAISIGNLGSTLAAAGLPAVAVVLIDAVGFRDAFRLTGLVVLVLVAPLAFVAAGLAGGRARPRGNDGAALAVLGGEPVPVIVATPAMRPRFPWREGGGRLLVILTAPPLVVTGAVFHATSILAERGLGSGAAAGVLAVLAVSGALGAVVAGVVLDRFGPVVVLVASSLLLGGGIALLLPASISGAYAAFAVMGVAGGLNVTVSGVVWAQTWGVERLGALQSSGDSARIAGAALGPLPLAISVSLTGSYDLGLLLLAGFGVACGALAAGWHGPARA